MKACTTFQVPRKVPRFTVQYLGYAWPPQKPTRGNHNIIPIKHSIPKFNPNRDGVFYHYPIILRMFTIKKTLIHSETVMILYILYYLIFHMKPQMFPLFSHSLNIPCISIHCGATLTGLTALTAPHPSRKAHGPPLSCSQSEVIPWRRRNEKSKSRRRNSPVIWVWINTY